MNKKKNPHIKIVLACQGKISKDAKSTFNADGLNILSISGKTVVSSTYKAVSTAMTVYDALKAAKQTITKQVY